MKYTPMPLTDVKIRNARATNKPQRLWDGGGLYLEVSPAGGKLWRLKYRIHGKEKLLALGKWEVVSLREARELRDDWKKVLGKGSDPSAVRKKAKRDAANRAINSFEAVAREWYRKQAKVWVPHHAADVLRRLEANLFPDLGSRPAAEITAPELLAALRKIEHRGAHDLAHRVLQVASQVFRYGVATGRCERDPAPDLRGALTPHRKQNQAAVKPDEVPALLRAIDAYAEIGGRQTSLALRLLALTFVRTGELLGAEWSEFELDGKAPVWIVPAERMKMRTEHVVPLSKQAVGMLTELKALAGESRYVLPGRNPDKPISNNTMLFALYRLGYKGRMTGHGFRAVASTLLNESGFRSDVIERQLAHCERNDVRGAYNRAEYLPERRTMMQTYADMLDALAQGARVIPLQRKSSTTR
jgi:integrase